MRKVEKTLLVIVVFMFFVGISVLLGLRFASGNMWSASYIRGGINGASTVLMVWLIATVLRQPNKP